MSIENQKSKMYSKDPTKITEDSFAMIRRELREDHGLVFESPIAEVIERMVHSTADFDFGQITVIDEASVMAGVDALRGGCAVVCDVNMIRVGVSAKNIKTLGGSLHCFVNDEAVRSKAAELNNTRSAAGIHLAHDRGLLDGSIVVIGNAPTALYAIIELIEAGVQPALVVGVPVGFISAVESKDDLLARIKDVPTIVTKGRKGGSPVAVSIVNALLRFALDKSHSQAEP